MDRGHRPQPTGEPLHEDDADAGASLILRIGILVAGGVISGLVASMPAALRLGGEGSLATLLTRWIILGALCLPTAVVAVAVLRRARVGLRELLGERAQLLVIGVLWWSVIMLGLLAVVGAVLRKTTHHHALAGVTFAVFAVMSGIVVALLARRTTAMLDRGGGKLQKVGLTIVGGCAVVVIALVLVRTAKATELHAAAGIVDAIALAICALMTSSRAFTKLRPLAVIGLPVAILVLVIGLTLLRFDPKLYPVLAAGAPLHTLVLDLFGH
ncbi:MAG: hypothetical protein U0270_06230 [Labilithrix sp.]